METGADRHDGAAAITGHLPMCGTVVAWCVVSSYTDRSLNIRSSSSIFYKIHLVETRLGITQLPHTAEEVRRCTTLDFPNLALPPARGRSCGEEMTTMITSRVCAEVHTDFSMQVTDNTPL
jgi:hypothetical protein